MINSPLERQYYTLSAKCQNCKIRQPIEREPITGKDSWCRVKKKKFQCTKHSGIGCCAFVPLLTPEENKERCLELRKMLGQPSKRKQGRIFQELCKNRIKMTLMEAKSLMLGDYVHLKIYHYGELIDTIARIAAINPREGAVDPTTFNVVYEHEEGKALFVGVRRNNIDPIPLNAEIFEKNGFVSKKGRFMQLGNFDNPPLILWHLVDEPVLGHPKNQLEIHHGAENIHVSFMCHYVHQLQHALRLCGIDMEIKLDKK